MIKSENFITIQGWMRTELKLKGNALLVFALIWGFSQMEGQKFTGNLQYIADWCGATKQGVIKNLKALIDKGLIAKEELIINGKKCCHYSTKFNGTVKQSLTDNSTKFNDTVKQSLTNNINNKNINNKNINNNKNPAVFLKSSTTETKPKESKYSKCVSLIQAFTKNEKLRKILIEYLNLLLEMTPNIYANQFKGKLNILKALSDNESVQYDIVNQSLIKGWKSFYPLPNNSCKSADNLRHDDRNLGELKVVDEEF